MGKIKELSTILTNQIAAGEVIERPSSVVKELLENSIDAHSRRIEIHIEEAGLSRIKIVDDGEGMVAEDAVLSIQRHTTSKIYSSEQLFRIRTLGFRGEALASIAAISELTVITSTGQESGTKLTVKGGEILSQEVVAPIKGTTMIVENLFFNTPARLKYVRTLQTELSHITDIISKLSLSHPEIAFVLYHDHSELLRTSGNGELLQAIAGNLGTNIARKMVPFEAENSDFKVSGYTSLPELTRSNRQYMSVFINGRSIKNFAMNKALIEGYGSTLMIGRYPISILNIEIDYLLVDVNVHPTKQEVRISKEAELAQLVKEAIHQAVMKVQRIPESVHQPSFKRLVEGEKPKTQQQSFYLGNLDRNEVFPRVKEPGEPIERLEEQPEKEPEQIQEDQIIFNQFAGIKEQEAKQTSDKQDSSLFYEMLERYNVNCHCQQKIDFLALAEQNSGTDVSQEPFPELYYFGQMHGTYLFAENEKGLYIIDQHAAQERIKYEQYKVEIGQVSPHLQQLLVPLVFDFSKKDSLKLMERREELEALGLFLEPFGQQSFQLQAHPSWIETGEEKEMIETMIDFVLADQKVTVAKLREATAIMMSCKRSIKANHHLSDYQARELITQLSHCQNPYNCPHGRPVLIHFSNKDMEKFFKRIQDSHQSSKKR